MESDESHTRLRGAGGSSGSVSAGVAGAVSIFGPPEGWKASEEVALLEAVELYGFGNWEDTATFVGKVRSAREVKDHFVNMYVNGNIGRVTWSSVDPEAFKVTDHTMVCSETGQQLSPSLTTPLSPISDLSPGEQQHLGYMPKRDDFEREFDNDVEALISTLRINPNEEEELDVDLKVAHIDMYNRRLKERFRKKAVVREYDLVSLFYKSLAHDPEVMSILQPPIQAETPCPGLRDQNLRSHQKQNAGSSSVSSSGNPSPSSSQGSPSSRPQHPTSPSRVSSPHSYAGSPSCPSPGVGSPKGGPSHGSFSMQSPSLKNNNHVKNSGSHNSSPHVKSANGSKKVGGASPGLKTLCSAPSSPTAPKTTAAGEKLRELQADKLRIFSQFISCAEMRQLLENLRREKELKSRVKELSRFRRNGLKSLIEVSSYESARSRRDKKKENKKKGMMTRMSTAKSLMVSQRNEEPKEPDESTSCDRLKSPKSVQLQSAKRAATEGKDSSPPSSASSKGSTGESLMLSKTGQKGAKRLLTGQSLSQTDPSTPPSKLQRVQSATQVSPGSSLMAPAAAGIPSPVQKSPCRETSSSWDHSERRADDESTDNIGPLRRLDFLDISSMPAARLLSPGEKKLCSSIRLTPSQYISLKGLMIKEKKSKKQKSGLESVDGRIRRRLNDFFTRSGWLMGS